MSRRKKYLIKKIFWIDIVNNNIKSFYAPAAVGAAYTIQVDMVCALRSA